MPQLELVNGAATALHNFLPAHTNPAIHLSLSDEADFAFASVIISALARLSHPAA
jgi:phosphopantetheinyl transferase (holo-ACP synthase)